MKQDYLLTLFSIYTTSLILSVCRKHIKIYGKE